MLNRFRFAPTVRIITAAAILLLLAGGASAQDTSTGPKDGYTPSGLAPGNPSGSYALSGFDSINPYNGKLNFSLPLVGVGGRGGAGFKMHLPINQNWTVRHSVTDLTDSGGGYWEFWDPLFNDNDWTPYLSPGVMIARQPGESPTLCTNVGQNFYVYYNTVTRLTFIAADGTEYELRDQVYGGQRQHHPNACTTPMNRGVSRGKIFTTADGTSLTFNSDEDVYDDHLIDADWTAPSGVLIFKDGTRYRIDGGEVSWIRDRNGNQITPNSTGWADSLGRQTTVQSASMVDNISYAAVGGTQQHTVSVQWAYLHDVLRPANAQHPAETLKTLGQLFPTYPNSSSGTYHDPVRPEMVVLPNGKSYKFYYNSYAELARVELPTGGAIEYDWVNTVPPPYGAVDQPWRRVAERRVYADGVNLESKTFYTQPVIQLVSTPHGDENQTTSAVDYFDGSGNKFYGEKHYYYGSSPLSVEKAMEDPIRYTPWHEGKEYQTEVYDAGGSLLRTMTQTWAQRAPVSWWTGNLNEEPSNDPRIVEATTTLADTGQVARQTFGYDQFNNQTDLYEFDYGKPYASRHTHTDYLTTNPANGVDYTTATVHIRNLPRAQQVYSVNPDTSAETLAVQSETKYDETALFPWYGAVQGWSDPGAYRGNPTKARQWLNTTGGWVEARAEFDQCGSVTKSYDANNNMSQMAYSATYHYAYPTQVTSPIPDPSGQYGSQTAFVTNVTYDFSTGLATSVTSPNNQTTNYFYADDQGNPDPFDRLRKVVRPGGQQIGGGGQTVYSYGDTPGNLYVRVQTSLDDTRSLDSYQYFDKLGRAVRSQQYENFDAAKPWLTVDTEYDALGRVKRASRPYRWSIGMASPFSTDKWAENVYDALGRVKTVTTKPDNAAATTDYSGNKVLVTDQAGKKRMSSTDALGRMTDVWEVTPADAATVTVAFQGTNYAAYPTGYIYDALGNLRTVTQATPQTTQTRTFVYNSLGRLTSATNPENGTVNYTYDNNGNLLTKTDARPVTTTYGYDALNRNTTVRYSDAVLGVGNHTKDIDRHYDGAINGKGRFWYFNWDAANNARFDSHLAIDEYDAMGRPKTQRHRFLTGGVSSLDYTTTRTYDLAGNIKTQIYPSGHTVSYNYDAAGRIGDNGAATAFSGNLGDGTPRTYASEVRYQEMGGREQERFGTDTPVYNKHLYNSRGQLAEIRVSTYSITAAGQETNWNRGAIINHYSNGAGAWGATGGGPDNNGNLRRQEMYIPNDDQISGYFNVVQHYGYDALNRLTSVEDKIGNTTTNFYQSYQYDRWGNRTINAASTTNAPEPQFSVSTATNQLGVPAGQYGSIVYDPAGNLTTDTYQGGNGGGGTRTYDAENRMTAAQFVGGQLQTASYTYDGDGKRIKRNMGASGEVWQVYGMGGELLAEYAPNAAPNAPQKEYGYRDGELLVTAEAPASTSLTVSNSGFETPVVGGGSFQYGPTGGTWTFAGGSGISGNSSGFTSGNPSAPEGAQVAFVQGGNTSIISQSVSGFQAGTNYTVSFKAARRGNGGGMPDFDVYLDTTLLGTFQPSGTSYASFSTASFTTTAGSHTLKFVGRNTAGGDNTAFVDDVRVAIAPATQSFVTGKSLGALRADYTGHVGMRITVGAQALTVASLGRIYVSGNTGTHTLKVVRASDNAVVASTELSMTGGVSGQFKYAALASAVTLAANTDYYVVSMETSGGDTWYDYFGTVVTTTSAASVRWGMYGDGVNWGPAGGAGNSYVPVDFQYQTSGGAGGTANLQWMVADQLGTPRMVVDKTGALSGVRRHDYLPFGEEVAGDAGGRTTARGYVADTVRQKFTGYERDTETSLDFAQARYYASAQGRFTGVDPLMASASPVAPQSWNRYSYALNNPLKYVDPSGMNATIGGGTAEDQEREKKQQKPNPESTDPDPDNDQDGIVSVITSVAEWIKNAIEPTAHAGALERDGAGGGLPMGGGGGVPMGGGGGGFPVGGGSVPPPVASRGISLGLNPHNNNLANQTGALSWRSWFGALTSRNPALSPFGRVFSQASGNTDRILFALDGLESRYSYDAVFQYGSRGFIPRPGPWGDSNITNAEFFSVYTNPGLFNKTQFYFRGDGLIYKPASPPHPFGWRPTSFSFK